MNRRSALPLTAFSLLFVSALGCASSAPEGQPADPHGAEGSGTATTASASSDATGPASSASAEPSASSSSAASGSASSVASSSTGPKGKRSFRFEAYDGPKVKRSFEHTPVAWVVRPAGSDGSFEENKLALMALLRTQGDDVVVQYEGGELAVPMALAQAGATPLGLKTGDTVFSNTGSFGAVARVQSIDEKKGMTKIKFVVGADVQEKEISRQAMLKLDERASFGRPVAFKDGATWRHGLFGGGDAKKGFVALGKGWKVVDSAAIKPLKILGAHAKGAKVVAGAQGTLSAGVVEEVLDGGLRYKVKLADGSSATLGFDVVSAPVE